METKELAAAIGKPSLLKLKEVGKGVKVGRVLGDRILVRTIQPYTDLDRYEETPHPLYAGKPLLVAPPRDKEANTPRPSTGIIVQLGEEVHSFSYKDLGTAVMFSRFAGSDINVEEEEFRVLETRDIMCTLVPAEPED